MKAELQLSGPTVTLFGDHDALDAALSEELGRRGCSTHAITTPVGWLDSVSHAVVRLDTLIGQNAMNALATRDAPATHVVAVCCTPTDDETSARLDELCRSCADRHDVSLIWHPPFDIRLGESAHDPLSTVTLVPDDLAATIADEVGHQEAWTNAPSFVSQTFQPHRHRGRS